MSVVAVTEIYPSHASASEVLLSGVIISMPAKLIVGEGDVHSELPTCMTNARAPSFIHFKAVFRFNDFCLNASMISGLQPVELLQKILKLLVFVFIIQEKSLWFKMVSFAQCQVVPRIRSTSFIKFDITRAAI